MCPSILDTSPRGGEGAGAGGSLHVPVGSTFYSCSSYIPTRPTPTWPSYRRSTFLTFTLGFLCIQICSETAEFTFSKPSSSSRFAPLHLFSATDATHSNLANLVNLEKEESCKGNSARQDRRSDNGRNHTRLLAQRCPSRVGGPHRPQDRRESPVSNESRLVRTGAHQAGHHWRLGRQAVPRYVPILPGLPGRRLTQGQHRGRCPDRPLAASRRLQRRLFCLGGLQIQKRHLGVRFVCGLDKARVTFSPAGLIR